MQKGIKRIEKARKNTDNRNKTIKVRSASEIDKSGKGCCM